MFLFVTRVLQIWNVSTLAILLLTVRHACWGRLNEQSKVCPYNHYLVLVLTSIICNLSPKYFHVLRYVASILIKWNIYDVCMSWDMFPPLYHKDLDVMALSINLRFRKFSLSFFLQSSLVDLPLKNYYRYVIPTLVCQNNLSLQVLQS